MSSRLSFQRMLRTATAVGCLGLAQGASAADLVVSWTDLAGDGGPVGDAVAARLRFDAASGSWTAFWEASPANPFTGHARFNLNLFNAAQGNPATAPGPQVSLASIVDFGTGTATRYSYSGITPFLATWHAGDLIATGNGATFQSGVVDMNSPYGRDILGGDGRLAAAVPEAETFAMLLAGLGLVAFASRRRRRVATV